MTFKYLHKTSEGNYYLDHRLNFTVRAMFCAMASRIPGGGIEARYIQIREAVAEGVWDDKMAEVKRQSRSQRPLPTWKESRDEIDAPALERIMGEAEDQLCDPDNIHPKVQEFFDRFVLQYGHSSILELTGSPSVYTQGISLHTAYLLFESPLYSGQEFSTRALRRKDWPMARECWMPATQGGGVIMVDQKLSEGATEDTNILCPPLEQLHKLWLEIFDHEVEAWKVFFSDADNRAAYGIKDKEPFRPALDRARWALPGTLATGVSHTGHLRERARVLRDGSLLAQKSGWPAAIQVWDEIRECYAQAAPALASMGLREAVYDEGTARLPFHLDNATTVPLGTQDEVVVQLFPTGLSRSLPSRGAGQRAYLDPGYNHMAQVGVSIRCSIAVARDWHRHRTLYPWSMSLVVDEDNLTIHPHYEARSEFGKANLGRALALSQKWAEHFETQGNSYMAMHCYPLGTQVELDGQAGLRDAVYAFELRRDAHGANFEYQKQATEALQNLRTLLEELDPELPDHLGL